MSTNLEDFFGSIRIKRNDPTLKLFDFVEKTIMQLAEVVQQLDEKLTGMEASFGRVRSDLEEVKRRPAGASAPSLGGGSMSVPPPPVSGGGGGLPPLPGMGGGLGGGAPRPGGGEPPGDRPMSPMMVQANLQNELKAAFKNIRARLESGDE